MQQTFTTDVINLKSYNLSEADKILIMYSKDKGLIKGVAKGVKKTSSKLGGRMDLLVANKLMLNKGKNLDTICQAEALNTFFHLRADYNKLMYSMYCAEIVSNFGSENDPNSEEIYNLFYSCLERISKSKSKIEVMLSVIRFQLKIMFVTGYSIELNNCVKCGSTTNDMYFSKEQGGIICSSCAAMIAHKIKIHYKIINFLNTLLKEDFNSYTQYDELATEKVCSTCILLLKEYIEFYSPKKFKTADVIVNML